MVLQFKISVKVFFQVRDWKIKPLRIFLFSWLWERFKYYPSITL